MMSDGKIISGKSTAYIPAHLSFGQFVIDTLNEGEDGFALINGETGVQITRKCFLQEIIKLATGLRKLGVKKGDIVALCSESRLEVLVTCVASFCCGAIITTINPAYTEDELKHVLNISKPKYVFCSEQILKNKYYLYFKNTKSIHHIIQFENGSDKSIMYYNNVISKYCNVNEFEVEPVNGATDTALILYSSGTTGLPKGVLLTHVNFLYMVLATNTSPITRYLTVVPWYHGYGLMTTIAFLLRMKTMIYLNGFVPEMYLTALQKYQAEALLAVPPMILFFIKSPLVNQYDLSSVQFMLCAAAPLDTDTTKELLRRFPNCKAVLQAYGMTETALAITMDDVNDFSMYKPGSGGYPVPGSKLKVVDIETRKLLPAYEKGEICVKSPGIMKGYAGNPAATRETMDDQGYIKTGDIGYYDNDGYIFIVDRLKELIKYKAHQVAPAEVEGVILQHPSVSECGVVGAPDLNVGERATAFVVRKPGAVVTEKEIADFVASKLSPTKHLHGGVIFVSEIPKNPSGKILRRMLKEKLKNKSKL